MTPLREWTTARLRLAVRASRKRLLPLIPLAHLAWGLATLPLFVLAGWAGAAAKEWR